jgi:hypothetical protein
LILDPARVTAKTSYAGDAMLYRTGDLALALGTATITVLLQRHRSYDAALLASARALFDTTARHRELLLLPLITSGAADMGSSSCDPCSAG